MNSYPPAEYIGDAQAPRSRVSGAPGWMTDDEEAYLSAFAVLLPLTGATIVEVGVEYGRSSIAMLRKCLSVPYRTVHFYAVDEFPAREYGDMAGVYRHNLGVGGCYSPHHFIRLLKGTSWDVGRTWEGGAIHLLFIDACHWYDCVKRDIAAWMPHVVSGGFVVFHDATPPTNISPHEQHFEVQRAIDEWHAANRTTWAREFPPVGTMRAFFCDPPTSAPATNEHEIQQGHDANA